MRNGVVCVMANKLDMMRSGAMLLPESARRRLQQAAQTPNTESDPAARLKAVEKAIDWVKINYPGFFRNDYCGGE